VVLLTAKSFSLQAQTNEKDTILTYAVIYDGDTIEAKTLSDVAFYSHLSNEVRAKRTRLKNAIMVTYPYAVRAGAVLNDINLKLTNVTDKSERRKYIRSGKCFWHDRYVNSH